RLGELNGVVINGNLNRRLAGNSSLTFAEVDAEALIANVPSIAVSTGSACASGAPEPSHVLTAIGLSRSQAYQTIRVGLGRFTTASDIELAAEAISGAVQRIRGIPSAVAPALH